MKHIGLPLLAGACLLVGLLGVSCDDLGSGAAGFLPAAQAEEGVAASTIDHGCADLSGAGSSPAKLGCDDDDFEFVVEGSALRVFHRNAEYNCCPQEIRVQARVAHQMGGRGRIVLAEREILGDMACLCTCCHEVETLVPDLAPGTYYVRYCWHDRRRGRTCHVERIEIP